MSCDLILTVIGNDKPGLVEALAQVVSHHQGNWQESRFAHLAGKFAGILRVSVPLDQASPLETALAQVAGLKVSCERAGSLGSSPYQQQLSLKLTGHDRIGIVRDVSQVLAGLDINVAKLTTRVSSAPMSGEPLFEADATLQAPAGLEWIKLSQALEQLSDDLMVEISPLE
jgi:glycine cleavage system regulatory protein